MADCVNSTWCQKADGGKFRQMEIVRFQAPIPKGSRRPEVEFILTLQQPLERLVHSET